MCGHTDIHPQKVAIMSQDPLFDLTGQVVVITGGGGVLASAIARGLAERGARLVLLGRTAEKLEQVSAAIRTAGGEAIGITADVTDRAGLEGAATIVAERFGRVDHLVNAAGGNRAGANAVRAEEFFTLDVAELRQVIDLNLTGVLLASQVFGRLIAERGAGSVLNISSMAAQRPLTRVVAYAAAKAAVDNFTRWLAVTLAREVSPQVRVNALAPGFFVGEQNRALLLDAAGNLTPRGQTIVDHTPMGRFGEPDELVGAATWLLSPGARFVTGIVVPVDGGFSAFSGV